MLFSLSVVPASICFSFFENVEQAKFSSDLEHDDFSSLITFVHKFLNTKYKAKSVY